MLGSDAVYKIEFETLFKRPNKVRFAWTLEAIHTPGHKQTGARNQQRSAGTEIEVIGIE